MKGRIYGRIADIIGAARIFWFVVRHGYHKHHWVPFAGNIHYDYCTGCPRARAHR